jgi:hypothetical protein
MSKASWLKVDPSQGSGNTTVKISSSVENTGRNARATTLTWTAANVTDVVRTVSQAGKPEYISMTNSASADKDGKTVTINGKSNSAKLTFSLGSGDLDLTLPKNYSANSVNTANGAEIAGDPGATSEYEFFIPIIVPANPSITEKTRQLVVRNEAGQTAVCTIRSAAGDAYVTVQEGTIELDYQGTPVSWTVESNTTWTIS